MNLKQPTIIELRDVSLELGGKHILKDISFNIKKNELIGLVGLSGAGKTTLLRILTCLYKPSRGKISFHVNVDNDTTKDKIGHHIGFASQEGSFYHNLTVQENIDYFSGQYNLSKKKIQPRMDHLLKMLKLEHTKNTLAKNLSGGMKRRLDLALALINDPEIIILDEPTNGLDIILQEDLWRFITKAHSLGKTIIVSSHNLQEVTTYCTSIIFVSNQKVVEYKNDPGKSLLKNVEKIFREVSHVDRV